jgi:hypothetical protein
MNFKNFIPVSFLFVIFAMFMPFLSIYSFGFRIITMTGFQLGFTMDSVIYLQIITFAALVGLVLGVLHNKNASLFTTICGVVGFIALVFYFVEIQGVGDVSLIDISYSPELGFYLSSLFMLTATVFSLINLQRPALSNDRTHAYAIPRHGGRQVNHTLPQSKQADLRDIRLNQTVPMQNIPVVHPEIASSIDQVTEPMGYDPTAAMPRSIPKHYQYGATGQATGNPKLVGIRGQYAGQLIDLSAGQITIGRDPSIANLIYMQTNKDISRKHCTIGYDNNRQSFILTDNSTNGTYLFPQERLMHGKPVYIESGTRFFISDPSEQFEVRLD